jgi:hypothetical protein
MSLKILLIEDEEGARFGFKRYLSRAGYMIQEAGCLSEAREAFLSQRLMPFCLISNCRTKWSDWITVRRVIRIYRYYNYGIGDIMAVGDAAGRFDQYQWKILKSSEKEP